MSSTPLLKSSPVVVATEMVSDVETQSEQSETSQNYGSVEQQPPTVANLNVILFCLLVNVFLSSLDSTMVATLLSLIASELNSLPNLSWIATSYLLACAAFQPLFGKISDVFGRKDITIVCAFLFAFGCLICGITNSFWILVLGRLITGIGGGGFLTLSSITLSDLVPTRDRGVYQGYINVSFGLGTAGGGVIAGFIEQYFGWRMTFLLQIPVCILSAYLVYVYLELPPDSPGRGVQGSSHWKKLRNLDLMGSFLLVVSLLLLMYAASAGGKDIAYVSWSFAALVIAGVAGLTGFYFYELNVALEPVIPVRLLHDRTVFSSSLSCWFLSMNAFSILYFVPFYWLTVKGLSPFECGKRLIPGAITIPFGSIYAGHVIKNTGKYWNFLLISGLFGVLGSLGVCFLQTDSGSWLDYLVLIPSRFSTGSVITIDLIATISSVKVVDQALVTSIQYGFRSTGSTLGVALASAFLQAFLSIFLQKNFNNLENVPEKFQDPAKLARIMEKALQSSEYVRTKCPEFARAAVISAYDKATHVVFIFLLVTALATVISGLYIEENDLDTAK